MNDVRNSKLTKSRTSASLKEFWTDTHSTDSTDTNESGAHSRKFCKISWQSRIPNCPESFLMNPDYLKGSIMYIVESVQDFLISWR